MVKRHLLGRTTRRVAVAAALLLFGWGAFVYLSKWRPHPLAINTRTVQLDDGSLLRVFVLHRGATGRDPLWLVHDVPDGRAAVILEGWEYSGTQWLWISDTGEITVDYWTLSGPDDRVTLDLRAADGER